MDTPSLRTRRESVRDVGGACTPFTEALALPPSGGGARCDEQRRVHREPRDVHPRVETRALRCRLSMSSLTRGSVPRRPYFTIPVVPSVVGEGTEIFLSFGTPRGVDVIPDCGSRGRGHRCDERAYRLHASRRRRAGRCAGVARDREVSGGWPQALRSLWPP